MAEPLRKLGGKSGKPVVSHDGGATWQYEEAAAPAPQAPQAPAPQPRQGHFVPDAEMEGRAGRRLGQDLIEGTQEAAAGVSSGLTMGFDDEIADGLTGSNYGDKKRQLQARSAARADTTDYAGPGAFTSGEILGSTLGAKGAGAGVKAATKAGSTAGRLAGAAAGNVATGAIEGAGNAAPGDKLAGAARGAATGAAVTGAGKLISATVGGAGRAVGKFLAPENVNRLQKHANDARVQSVGLNVGEIDQKPGGVARQAETLRKYGVGKGLFAGSGKMEEQVERGVDGAQMGRESIEKAVRPDAVIEGSVVARPLGIEAKKFAGAAIGDEAAAYAAKAKEVGSVRMPGVAPKPQPLASAAPAPVSSPANVGATNVGGRRPRNLAQAAQVGDARNQLPGPTVSPDGAGGGVIQRQPPRAGALAPTELAGELPAPKKMGMGVAPPPTQDYDAPRYMNLEQLRKGRRHYSPDNWKNDSSPQARKKDFRQAYAGGEDELIEREIPGAAKPYRQLGQDMQGLIEAQGSLRGRSGARMPATKLDAARQVGRSGWAGNTKAKVQEGVAGLAAGADKTRAVAGAARRVGNAAASAAASPSASVLTRRVAQEIETAEYPEDEYFRQYMSNPDWRHSSR